MAYQPLDGPSKQFSLSVGTGTVIEVKKTGEDPLTDRQVITLQPLDGYIYVYFGDGESTPSPATVAADGFEHYKRLKDSYEAGPEQPVYILAKSGTVNVKVAERA